MSMHRAKPRGHAYIPCDESLSMIMQIKYKDGNKELVLTFESVILGFESLLDPCLDFIHY